MADYQKIIARINAITDINVTLPPHAKRWYGKSCLYRPHPDDPHYRLVFIRLFDLDTNGDPIGNSRFVVCLRDHMYTFTSVDPSFHFDGFVMSTDDAAPMVEIVTSNPGKVVTIEDARQQGIPAFQIKGDGYRNRDGPYEQFSREFKIVQGTGYGGFQGSEGSGVIITRDAVEEWKPAPCYLTDMKEV
ncbi:MAG: hypothetical protein Q9223_004183 [Gallowayella weberi]